MIFVEPLGDRLDQPADDLLKRFQRAVDIGCGDRPVFRIDNDRSHGEVSESVVRDGTRQALSLPTVHPFPPDLSLFADTGLGRPTCQDCVLFCAVGLTGRRRFRIRPVFETAGAPHPRQRPDGAHPVGETGDEAEIPLHMLLADPAGRDHPAGRERERRAEDRLQHEYALGMMPQRPMPEIACDRFQLVDYVDSHQQ